MRASLIRGNLVIVTVNIDIDDNIGLVRFLHGIHLLVIIGPQNWGDFPSANNKEILQPYILNSHQHKSDFPNSLFCSVQHQITWHSHNETHIHTDYKCSHSVTVFVCHCVGGDEVLMALLPEKNASLPIGTMPPAFWSRAKRSLIWPLVLTMWLYHNRSKKKIINCKFHPERLWVAFSYTTIWKEEIPYLLPAIGLAFFISQQRRFFSGRR